jgi:hypothetical protein
MDRTCKKDYQFIAAVAPRHFLRDQVCSALGILKAISILTNDVIFA